MITLNKVYSNVKQIRRHRVNSGCWQTFDVSLFTYSTSYASEMWESSLLGLRGPGPGPGAAPSLAGEKNNVRDRRHRGESHSDILADLSVWGKKKKKIQEEEVQLLVTPVPNARTSSCVSPFGFWLKVVHIFHMAFVSITCDRNH